MFSFKKLQHKLLFWFLLLSLVPLAVFAAWSVQQASASIKQGAIDKLTAIAHLKQEQISTYFRTSEETLQVVSGEDGVQSALLEFVTAYTTSGNTINSEAWRELDEEYSARIDNIVKSYGWHDLFLISPQGDIVYSQAKEADLGKNIKDPAIRGSGLELLLNELSSTNARQTQTSDFSPYAPSNGVPAAFQMTKLIGSDGTHLGYVALQLPVHQVNDIMQSRVGMESTAETYLVGSDKRMRSDSYIDPQGHSVEASFAGTVEKNGVNSSSVTKALAGSSGNDLIIDYNGNLALSVYMPLQVGQAHWALLAEIDAAEAFQMADQLKIFALVIFIAAIALVSGIAVLIARQISQPVVRLATTVQKVSEGDLTVEFEQESQDEIGQLQLAMQNMVVNLSGIINHIDQSSHQQASAAHQLSSVTTQTKDIVSRQHAATDQVAAAINEMSATVDEVARNTSETANAAKEADQQVSNSKEIVSSTVTGIRSLADQLSGTMDKMNDLAQGVTNISSILGVIKGIADQTNLLALNAAIEAARAGDQGRGFAVVADEVRSLAKNTQTSASEIEAMIGTLQAGASTSVKAMQQGTADSEAIVNQVEQLDEALAIVKGSVEKIGDMSIQIASAAEEQSLASNEISRNASEIGEMSEQSNLGAEQIAEASTELSRLSEELMSQVQQFKIRKH